MVATYLLLRGVREVRCRRRCLLGRTVSSPQQPRRVLEKSACAIRVIRRIRSRISLAKRRRFNWEQLSEPGGRPGCRGSREELVLSVRVTVFEIGLRLERHVRFGQP